MTEWVRGREKNNSFVVQSSCKKQQKKLQFLKLHLILKVLSEVQKSFFCYNGNVKSTEERTKKILWIFEEKNSIMGDNF